MANFFTRPDLDDRQFRQDSTSSLTLSGNTNFAGVLRSKDVEIDATISTTGSVLTYNGSKIVLLPLPDSGQEYSGATPAAITVGGISAGYTLTGKSISNIIQDLLVPTLFPTLTAPNNIFSDNQANTQEVGVTASTINFTSTFSRGSISPAYGTSGFRSGLPNNYNYSDNGNVDQSLPADVASTSLTDIQQLTDVTILAGANTWSSSVDYDAGEQPLDSEGSNFNSPLVAGTTGIKSTTITGIYPYFFGTFSSGGASAGANRPNPSVSAETLITASTKVVATSTGTLTINFNSTSDDYIFFATPAASTTKTVWNVSALNNGIIGGSVNAGGNLFPDPVTVSIDSPDGLWFGINYKIYVSNFQTEVTDSMELRNS